MPITSGHDIPLLKATMYGCKPHPWCKMAAVVTEDGGSNSLSVDLHKKVIPNKLDRDLDQRNCGEDKESCMEFISVMPHLHKCAYTRGHQGPLARERFVPLVCVTTITIIPYYRHGMVGLQVICR